MPASPLAPPAAWPLSPPGAVNSINRVWPRAAAVAERLWSPKEAADADAAAARLADLRCRMLSRGIAAQSMGPGFCPGELTTRM